MRRKSAPPRLMLSCPCSYWKNEALRLRERLRDQIAQVTQDGGAAVSLRMEQVHRDLRQREAANHVHQSTRAQMWRRREARQDGDAV